MALLTTISDSIENKFYIPFFKLKSRLYLSKVFPNVNLSAYGIKLNGFFDFILKDTCDPYDIMQNAILDVGQKIIVVIDDMDRLTSKEILTLLRFIRTTLHLKNVSVVCCLDSDKCRKALEEEKIESTYVQKIFTEEFHVSKIDYNDLKNYLIDELNSQPSKDDNASSEKRFKSSHRKWNIDKDYAQHLKDVENLLSKPFSQDLLRNVRHVKKIIKSFYSNLPLLFSSTEDSEQQLYQINLSDWLCLEMIRIHSSYAYNFLKASCDARYQIKENSLADASIEIEDLLLKVPTGKSIIHLDHSIMNAMKYLLSNRNADQQYKFSDFDYRINYFSYRKSRGVKIDIKALKALEGCNYKALSKIAIENSHLDTFPQFLNILSSRTKVIASKRNLFSVLLNSIKNDNFKSSFKEVAFPVNKPDDSLKVFEHALYAANLFDPHTLRSETDLTSLGNAMINGAVEIPWFAELTDECKVMFEGVNLERSTSFGIADFIASCLRSNDPGKYEEVYKIICQDMLANLTNDFSVGITKKNEKIERKVLILYFLENLMDSKGLGSRENIIYRSRSAAVQKEAIDVIAPSFHIKSDDWSREEKDILNEGYDRIYSSNANGVGKEFTKLYHCSSHNYAKFLQFVYENDKDVLPQEDIDSYVEFRHAIRSIKDVEYLSEWKSDNKRTNQSSVLDSLLHDIEISLSSYTEKVKAINSSLKQKEAKKNLINKHIDDYISNNHKPNKLVERSYHLYRKYQGSLLELDAEKLLNHFKENRYLSGTNPYNKMISIIKVVEEIQTDIVL